MLKITLKFLLAFALCYWLIANGKLDFSLISQAISLGPLWILGLLLLLSRLFIATFRFRILLQTKTSETLSYLKILSFDAIGSFFSVILPGSAAGDLVRFFYYKNLTGNIPAPTVAAFLILERLIGLLGLVVLGTLICVIQFKSILALDPKLLTFIIMNAALSVGLLLFIAIFFGTHVPLHKLSHYLTKWPKVFSLFNELINIKLKLIPFLQCFLISVFSHAVNLIGFWALCAPFLPKETSFLNLFTVLPIGMIGADLPISPGGLGVGHVLFDNLFKLVQVNNGASLFNLYFVAHILVCLLGVFPYLLKKR